MVALGLTDRETFTPKEAGRVYSYVNQQLLITHGAAYQGAAADPIAFGHEADLDGNRDVSRLELLLGLVKLVRLAHWHESVGSFVARV